MELTKAQTKSLLHVGDAGLRNLVKAGRIKPLNEPKNGAKKFFAKFDSKAVDTLRKELKAERPAAELVEKIEKRLSVEPPVLAQTVFSRLDRIEDMLKRLCAAWGV